MWTPTAHLPAPRTRLALGLAALAFIAMAPAAFCQPQLVHPFTRGRVRISMSGGTGETFGERYFAFGAGVGVFLFDGFELAVDGEVWLGGDPTIGKVSPGLRYVFYQLGDVAPYVGAFYKRWFLGGGFADVSTVGGRAGIYVTTGALILGAGVAHERIVSSCTASCNDTYPEISLSLVF